MERISIVTSADSSFAPHAGVMLLSLFENNKLLEFDIYVLHNGIRKKDKRKLSNLVDLFGHNLFLHQIEEGLFVTFPTRLHATIANYFRILIPEIMSLNITKAIYLDADTLVLQSIAPLLKIDISTYAIAAVITKNEERSKVLEVDPEDGYFNSGVMIINVEKWRNENISQKLIKYIITNPEKLKFWDQDALNKVLIKDKIGLDTEWNVCNECEIKDINRVGILHFVGPYKPWHIRCKHSFRNLYHEFRMKSPWEPIKFREQGSFHRIKQSVKRLINKLFGTSMNIYQYDNFSH